MKTVVLNISDSDLGKLRFEAIHEKKSVNQIIKERIWEKPFHPEVLEAFDAWMEEQLLDMMKG